MEATGGGDGPAARRYPDVVERSASIYATSSRPLPFPMPLPPMPGSANMPINPNFIAETCGFKLVLATGVGAGLGLAMGVFLGAMGDVAPIQLYYGREVPFPPISEQARTAWRATAGKSVSWAKNFAQLSAIFAGTECVVEKLRGKHDVWNSISSGCVAGAALSASSGPSGMAFGCVGFAAFSAAMEALMGQH